jgi:hypothetical protein
MHRGAREIRTTLDSNSPATMECDSQGLSELMDAFTRREFAQMNDKLTLL